MAFVPLAVIDMWDVATYQIGVALLCLYLNFTTKYVTIQHLEQVP